MVSETAVTEEIEDLEEEVIIMIVIVEIMTDQKDASIAVNKDISLRTVQNVGLSINSARKPREFNNDRNDREGYRGGGNRDYRGGNDRRGGGRDRDRDHDRKRDNSRSDSSRSRDRKRKQKKRSPSSSSGSHWSMLSIKIQINIINKKLFLNNLFSFFYYFVKFII